MAESTTQAGVPEAVASGTRPGRVATSLRGTLRWLGVLPFGVYIALGLIAPTIAIAERAADLIAGRAPLAPFDPVEVAARERARQLAAAEAAAATAAALAEAEAEQHLTDLGGIAFREPDSRE